MSGGHFDGAEYQLEEMAENIDILIYENHDELTEQPRYSEETIRKFAETAHWLRRAKEMAIRVDYLVSGDDSEETFHKRWKKEVRDAETE